MKTAKPEDWKTEPLPSDHSSINLERLFSPGEITQIRRGVLPDLMDDKWFIYWLDDTLCFHRSWTGYCIYVVSFVKDDDGYRMVAADLNRDPNQYSETSDEIDREMISFLIDVLLLHQEADYPCDDTSPEKRAVKMWSQIGRAMLEEHPDD